MDQIDVEEKKKMFDLMKDRELGGNMDWMYRGDKTDKEEFLLGKSVDKLLSEATSAEEGGGGSIISERIKANVTLDMQAKMREDPLFAIRKKEEDARRRLLENPVKMKQLEKLVEQQRQFKSKAAKKAKKEKKSKTKKKKKKRSRDIESDSSSSSEDDLVNQYLTILTQKKKNSAKPEREPRDKHPRERESARESGDHHDRSEKYRRDEQRQHDKYSRDSKCSQHEFRREPGQSKTGQIHERDNRYKEASSLDRRKRLRERDSSESSDGEQQQTQRQGGPDRDVSTRVYGLIKSVRNNMSSSGQHQKIKSGKPKRSRSPASSSSSPSQSPRHSDSRRESKRHPSAGSKLKRRRSRSSSRSRSPVRKRDTETSRTFREHRAKTPPKKKLTAEEKERKLQEMMEDAKWRDNQRTKNVQHYKREEEEESSQLSTYHGDPNFLCSMMSEHAAKSSLEDRLNRNKYNIQRTPAVLDKKFTQH